MAEMLLYRCGRDRDAPARARALVASVLPDVDPSIREDAKLMVSELMTNAVRYGAGEATLTVHRAEGRVNFAVSDEGEDRPQMRSPSSAGTGGFGLRIVDNRAAKWGVEDGSTHVWFELALPETCES